MRVGFGWHGEGMSGAARDEGSTYLGQLFDFRLAVLGTTFSGNAEHQFGLIEQRAFMSLEIRRYPKR